MSRIGKKPVTIPAGVKINVAGQKVTVEGPKGKLELKVHPSVKVTWAESEKSVVVESNDKTGESSAHWGTTRAHIRNMVEGVTKGYEKTLEVVGVGWTAALAGKALKLTVGFANTLTVPIPAGLNVTVDKQLVKVAGFDRQAVGQFAASVRSLRKPEPYNGKGIKYTTETIRRKQGKQFGS